MYNLVIFLAVACPRLFYIFLTDQSAGDTPLYIRIASNILSGCGFSASQNLIFCEPIIGGYFPAYPYLVASLIYLGFSEKMIACLIGICFALSILYLKKALELVTNHSSLACVVALVVGLSPLNFGWSRFLLIEPVMTIFSVLVLSQLLTILHKKKIFDVSVAVALIAAATYFKPTSVLFCVPFCILVGYVFGLRKGFRILLASGISLVIAVIPWELRNWSLGGQSTLSLQSNIWPQDHGYSAWVHSWSVTEYERSYARFPVSAGRLHDVIINPNLFLSRDEADHAKALINQHTQTESHWNRYIDGEFSKLFVERQISLSSTAVAGLRTLQAFSLLLHPANSYGFPISLPNLRQVNSDRPESFGHYLSTDILISIIGKGILFFYRVLLWGVFSYLVFWILFSSAFRYEGQGTRFLSERVHVNDLRLMKILTFLALLIVMATLLFFVVIVSGLEHRYLGVVMLWVEVTVICHVFYVGKNIYQPSWFRRLQGKYKS
jgi:hypothetical protein